MSQPPSGMEPQIGGYSTPSEAERADADQCFEIALDLIRRERWDAARDSLRDTLELVHDYPQALGLLNLIRDIQGAILRGENERPQIDAMRAYINAFQNAPHTIAAPPVVHEAARAASAPISLPWASAPPPAKRAFPDLPPIAEPPAIDHAAARSSLPLPSLSASSPLDQLRVLWWFFIQPMWIKVYMRAGQGAEVERMLARMASGLLWLPLLIPAVGMALNLMPSPGLMMAGMLAILVSLWALSGWLMSHNSGTVALMVASGISLMFVVLVMNYAGFRTGALIGAIFLLLAGYAAGVNGIGAERSSAHLALGATFVSTVAAVYKMHQYITPIVLAYVGPVLPSTFREGASTEEIAQQAAASASNVMISGIGGPILIIFAVVGTGLVALGVTYVIPFIGTYFISFAVEAVLEENLGSGANPLGVVALTGMATLFAILFWVCVAGGWRIVDTVF